MFAVKIGLEGRRVVAGVEKVVFGFIWGLVEEVDLRVIVDRGGRLSASVSAPMPVVLAAD